MAILTDSIPNAHLILAIGACSLWIDSTGRYVALNSRGDSDSLLVLKSSARVLYDCPENYSQTFKRAVEKLVLA